MGKVGRRIKYFHWKYINSQPTGNSQTQTSPVLLSCCLPIEYQFPLCHFPPAVLHQSSLYNNITLKFSQFCQKVMLLKAVGI